MAVVSPFYSRFVHEAVLAAIESDLIDCTDVDTFYVVYINYDESTAYKLLITFKVTELKAMFYHLDSLKYDNGFDHVLVERPGQCLINMCYDPDKDVFERGVFFFEERKLYLH